MIAITNEQIEQAVQHEVRPEVVAENIRSAFGRVKVGDTISFRMGKREGEWFLNGSYDPGIFWVYELIDKGRLIEISRSDGGWLADKTWRVA